ncbi:MAG: helix-turn-helix transcriptional regulator [Leptospirales bacterium]|nr:helix-turn-helix transcriptional regulator [Leptospirales bacterium]
MGYAGDRIREERKQQRLKAGELAERCGITPSTLWRIESGTVEPQEETLTQIARGLKIDKALLVSPPSVTRSIAEVYPPREVLVGRLWGVIQKLRPENLQALLSLAERMQSLERQRDIAVSMAWASVGEDEPEPSKVKKQRKKK